MKKDFRLKDNPALTMATKNNALVLTVFEPSVSTHYDFDIRHWRFIYQSIQDLKNQGLNIHLCFGEVAEVLDSISNMSHLISHEETGNNLTFQRDLHIKKYCRSKNIQWTEFPTNAVKRGLRKRDGWDAHWIKYVKSPIVSPPTLISTQKSQLEQQFPLPIDLKDQLREIPPEMQIGGESKAQELLDSFINEKIENYWGNISYPDKSRYHCSRLSPHITYGNLSIKQIYQACDLASRGIQNRESIKQYMARLKWHCHFVQKFEMQPDIEYKNLNQAFDNIREKKNKKYIKAWKQGQTGYPLIDAAMRCLADTGYLNFRLRSTVVSFLTHLLWQPWQVGSGHLARMFLDYEPGIHFAQFQMQAGTTGINTIRIYNPIKQSKEKDKHATFIKRWVPELEHLPVEFIHEPWKMTEMDQMMYDFKLGSSYPKPIIDFENAQRMARDKLWEIKKSSKNKFYAKPILAKHARRGRRES